MKSMILDHQRDDQKEVISITGARLMLCMGMLAHDKVLDHPSSISSLLGISRVRVRKTW